MVGEMSVDDENGSAGRPIRRRRRTPTKLQCAEVWRRDNWLCRWCARPVIFAPVMRLLDLDAGYGPERLAYWDVNWTRTYAPLLDELGATIDHVLAFSHGGSDTVDNFYTACTKCNYRKGDRKVDIFVGGNPPRAIDARHGQPQLWEGLTAVFVTLAQRHASFLIPSDKKWLQALSYVSRTSTSEDASG